ncbi:TetR/AcrR family transcriptional regulator [Nonomuraea sp. NPDC050556]|uniref:TetR/AcrR family transcriptional regulator n=1 Tax=Nonomuraea sp. NPDC050556 TaxID=3364369 RepID=UPI00379E8214
MGPERREALVQAAYDRITRHGFDGLRLRDVATDVGIDHSTIHHHFPAKQDLITAVVDHATGQFRSTTPAEGEAADRLRAHLGALAEMIEQRPELHSVLRELDVRATRDPALRAVIDERERGWRAALTEVFRQEDAWAAGLTPAAGADLVIATVKGASLRPETARAVLRQLEELIIR